MIKLGISGKKGTGKSTVADYLVSLYGLDVFAFAHQLKVDLMNMGVPTEVLNKKPWPPWLRALAQLYGVSKRDADPMYWVDRCLDDIEDLDPDGVVIDDVRFLNEAEELRRNGYTLIRLELEDAQHEDTHISEIDLDNYDGWDYVISARLGDVDTLYDRVDEIMEREERSE